MISISYKIKFTILGALIVPLFGRIALHGTNFEYDLYRYIVPFFVGGLSGCLIGLMKDKYLATNNSLTKINEAMKYEIKEHKTSRKALQKSEEKLKKYLEAIDSMGVGIFIVDSDYHIRHMNKTMIEWFGNHTGSNCHQSIAGQDSPCKYCELMSVIESNKIVHYTPTTPEGRSFDIICYPLQNSDGSISKMEIIRDITERKQEAEEKEKLIKKLQETLEDVKTLSGLVPICAKCKNIRDDKGYWNRIESYIEKHSEAIFSHGICPTCKKELYGNQDWYRKNKKDTQS
ncbi:MAG: PAS domain-containing protein [Thermodesulfobacteriota bacterium]